MAVSVNIGARQLQQPGFVERLPSCWPRSRRLAPGRLDLELRETRALNNLASVCAIITACRKIGVSFALDDFACGHSSLTYLKNLPVSRINIDRSFVCDLLEGGENRAILEGVIGLAKAFHRQIVAEGVEKCRAGRDAAPARLRKRARVTASPGRCRRPTSSPGWLPGRVRQVRSEAQRCRQ
jgi:EAL domain-containing protein (putative c-di-GMP-specific phosphodiesterase class I)